MAPKINVFLVGAQKAGTTSLYDWIGQHPDICAPKQAKDYHFFTNEDIYKNGISHLERFYSDAKSVSVHGAVNYLYFHETAARRIYEYNSKAKIIICLREPVSRAVSAYMYCLKTLRENKSFSEALNAELQGKLSTFKQLSDNTYIDHGKYVDQIQGFRKYFPDEQIKVVFFESLIDEVSRRESMSDILGFLDKKEGFEFDFSHLNNSGAPKSRALNYVLRTGFLVGFLKPLFPRSLRKTIVTFLNEKNTSRKKIEVTITDEDMATLKKHLEDVGTDLYRRTGIDASRFWS